jgi:multiple antibiotic resistance protein
MEQSADLGLVMFLALFALYSPVAALSSYLPLVAGLSSRDKLRLATGLFVNVLVFAMVAIWVGEPVLEILGLSTAALSVTGGIALLYASIPMMRGTTASEPHGPDGDAVEITAADTEAGWRSILFTPVTFPLTVGGTTFGLLVAFSALTESRADQVAVTAAGVAYAAVTGVTIFLAGLVDRRLSDRSRTTLERIAGIMLTAIGVSLLASGGTQLVVDAWRGQSVF